MPDTDPAIRAHYAKLALKRLRAYPEGKWAEIRERIPAPSLLDIREAASTDWLPADRFIAVCDAILAVFGEDAAREFWTDLMRDSYDHGLLKPLTASAQFGVGSLGAGKLLKTAPYAWTLSTRACGELELVDEGAAGMRVRSDGLIPEILYSKGFSCVFYGACRAMLELFKARGEVRMYEHTPPGAERPQMAFHVLFEPAGAPSRT